MPADGLESDESYRALAGTRLPLLQNQMARAIAASSHAPSIKPGTAATSSGEIERDEAPADADAPDSTRKTPKRPKMAARVRIA